MKEAERGAIGESILGEGGGEDFLRYFNGTVFGLIARSCSWKFWIRMRYPLKLKSRNPINN